MYKDGYFHLRCMMDKMEQAADYHDELQREHKYNVHTNVSIVCRAVYMTGGVGRL